MTRHKLAFALAALAALAMLAAVPAAIHAQLANPPAEDVEGRDEWYWAQRMYPFTQRPYAQVSNLHQSLLAHLNRIAAASMSAPPLGGAWRPLGPDALWGFLIESGRIAAIVPAVAPGGPMYAGTASGGVWRSTNAGITWTPLTDNECGLTTGAMARDPLNASIVYAATGEGNGGLTGCGVLRSTNNGDSWSTGATGLKSSGGGSATFTSLVVDTAGAGSSSNVLIGSTNFGNAGIVRSTNAGSSWTVVLNTGPASSIIAHPTHAGTYYAGNRVAATATARGVYRSTDAGATWAQLPTFPNIDPNSVGRVEVAVTKASPNSLWALVGDRVSGGMLGLFRWDDPSSTWTQLTATGVTAALFGGQETYDLVLTVDPRNEKRIFIAGVRAFRSSDGGATFQSMAQEVHVDWHVIAFDPNNPDIMWAGTDGGVYLSNDAGDSWVSRSAGLSITQFYPGVSVDSLGTRITGGSQDNGTHIYSGTSLWEAISGGDGGYTAISRRDPNVQWSETEWSLGPPPIVGNIYRRDAAGLVRKSTGMIMTDRAQFIPPLVMDPVTPTKLYFGTFRLYRTVNDGTLWTPISGDLTTGTGTITSIGVSPADTNTIYVGTSDGRALISRDGGLTFTPATGLPNRFVTRVTPHPTDPLRALITLSGFGAPHVFDTIDGFATPVRNLTGNLIDAPTNVGIYLPSAGAILVGTDVGVFQSADNGVTWALGPSALPNVIVQDLVYQPAVGLLVAATYGRGMFAYDVGGSTAVLRGDANGDGKIDAFDALLIQQTLASTASANAAVYPRGDANCNGRIDSADLVLVLRAAVGLPNANACVGTIR